MAPVRKRTALRARTSRTTASQRGKYAPPAEPNSPPPNDDVSPADLHTGPASTSKRTASDAFGFDDSFKVNKKDKRTIRHNQLLAKVQDEHARVGKKALKRRRPGKKLRTNLDDLADALPDAGEEGAGGEEDWEGISEDGDGDESMAGVEGFRKVKRRRRVQGGEGKMAMKSLRHRPGAMKRKRRMEQGEMERFGRNLAQMVGRGQAAVDEATPQSVARSAASGAGGKDTDGGGGSAGEAAPGASQADRWAALRRFIGGTMEQNTAFAGAK
ncbi:hypothetical protein B0A50_05665 [Salinomyces thailandicus]|uniref:Ribosome biogenesis protein SLX9 n=1 Tax=Salinomyces thailandicus TaxID=706561 RepID=A0A4U0TUF0_9PEZI|nr:hypothetical protein B0A50_05665 [Salinomyces thailandica]